MDKPNILFVFSDQHRYHDLGSSGNPVVQTPHLDRLAGEGMVFDQAVSTYALCSPYRGQLLTGRYSHQNLVVDNEYKLRDGEITIAHALGEAGYHTGFMGKWHLGYGPYPPQKRLGFDYLGAYNCGYGFYKTEYWENEEGPTPFGCWSPEGETDLAIRYLEEQAKGGRPFALFLCWAPPHWPYEFPDEFNTYDAADIEVRPNVPEPLEEIARKELALYYGSISALDAQFGRLMDALERLGLAGDTIVCYTSDHGDHMWSHGYAKPGDKWVHHTKRSSKATPYDESLRVPFIARWPGRIPASARTSALLGTVDIMPSLLRLGNLDVPEAVAGMDLSHVFRGKDGPLRDSVYLQQMGEGWPYRGKWVGYWRGVRTERWTYARWRNDEDGPMLFDRENDPYELDNLAGKGQHAEVQQRLEARLGQYLAETDDPFETGERDDRVGMLMLGQEYENKNKWERN